VVRGWRGVLQLSFGLVLLAVGGCSPQNLAAANGKQDIPVHRMLTVAQTGGDRLDRGNIFGEK